MLVWVSLPFSVEGSEGSSGSGGLGLFLGCPCLVPQGSLGAQDGVGFRELRVLASPWLALKRVPVCTWTTTLALTGPHLTLSSYPRGLPQPRTPSHHSQSDPHDPETHKTRLLLLPPQLASTPCPQCSLAPQGPRLALCLHTFAVPCLEPLPSHPLRPQQVAEQVAVSVLLGSQPRGPHAVLEESISSPLSPSEVGPPAHPLLTRGLPQTAPSHLLPREPPGSLA